MKTRLTTYAKVNYPIDFEINKGNLMRNLQKRCQTGGLKAVKEGKAWYVVEGGKPEKKKSTNPLL